MDQKKKKSSLEKMNLQAAEAAKSSSRLRSDSVVNELSIKTKSVARPRFEKSPNPTGCPNKF